MGGEPIFIHGLRVDVKKKIKTILNSLHRMIEKNNIDKKSPVYGDNKPFSVAIVEGRLNGFAKSIGEPISTSKMYMSGEKLLHSIRSIKASKRVDDEDLCNFPSRMRFMKLYYDKSRRNYIYVDGFKKFVVNPNYKIKLRGGGTKRVLMITASKMNGISHFKEGKYIEIKQKPLIKGGIRTRS